MSDVGRTVGIGARIWWLIFLMMIPVAILTWILTVFGVLIFDSAINIIVLLVIFIVYIFAIWFVFGWSSIRVVQKHYK